MLDTFYILFFKNMFCIQLKQQQQKKQKRCILHDSVTTQESKCSLHNTPQIHPGITYQILSLGYFCTAFGHFHHTN